MSRALGAALDRRGDGERPERDVPRREIRVGRIEPVRRHPPRHSRQHCRKVRVVGAGDDRAVERHFVREVDERLLQIVEPAVVFEMLVVDVRNHRNRRKQLQERPVAFVRLGHHQLAAAQPRVAAERAQPPADHRRRIESGALEHQRDHRRRRRFAVRACDGDRVAQTHQLREHLGARDHRNLPSRGFPHFRIRGAHGRRDHDHVRFADVGCGVAVRDPNAERRQSIGDGRLLLI